MPNDKEENLERLVKSNLPMQFIKAHEGRWDHQQWLEFLDELQAKGYMPIDLDQIGLILEENKEIFQAKKVMRQHVEENADAGVFDTVTGTFETIRGKYGDDQDKVDLVSINYPHWLARLAVIYKITVDLIKFHLVKKPVDYRLYSYQAILALLQKAIDTNNKVYLMSGKKRPDFYREYLSLLSTLITAAFEFAQVEKVLTDSENVIFDFLDSKGEKSTQEISVIGLGDEKKLHESIMNLIITAEPNIKEEQKMACDELCKSDQIRYEEAFNEMKPIYQQISGQLVTMFEPES